MDYYAFGGTLSSYVNGSIVDKYKFTSKERDLETGYDYFGARYYDSKVGRWMSVDPLAEKYPGWSPYNYCLNNPLRLIDPDGMAPGDLFKSQYQAALDFGRTYNRQSIKVNKEYGSRIYITKVKGEAFFSYSVPNIGNSDNVHPSKAPKGTKTTAEIHTHAAYDKRYENDQFSNQDLNIAYDRKVDSYVVTPNGQLIHYTYNGQNQEGTVQSERQDLPSDPNDPNDPKSKNKTQNNGKENKEDNK